MQKDWKLKAGEEKIVHLMMNNDRNAIRFAHDLYGGFLTGAFRRKYPDRDDIDDVVTDILMRMFEKRASFNPQKGSLKAWLYKVGINFIISLNREKDRVRPIPNEVNYKVYRERLHDAIANNHFTSLQKVILNMDLDAWPRKGAPSKEIADLFCTNVNSINSQRSKAYASLKKCGVEHPLRVKPIKKPKTVQFKEDLRGGEYE